MPMPESEKKLFLLDAYALIYRAHFAFSKNPRITSKGKNTGVMFGFTNSLLEVLQKQQPTHIGVAFDLPGPTFRHEVYKEYKANRQETPEDIKEGVPVVKEIIKAFNIPILELPTYEADDIIGTIAKKAKKKGFTVYMMTPDKDFGQLVDDKILLYKPAFMGNAVDIMGVEEIKEKWGIDHVDQVRDMLGMQGDASDNIPGIPGVGPKTAQKYIKAYGSVESLVKHAHDLKGKQKENVEKYGAQGIMSKQLATIVTDAPIDFKPEELKYESPDESKLRALFEELEFRTLLQRVLGGTKSPSKIDRIKISPEESQLDLFSQSKLDTKSVRKDKASEQEEKEETDFIPEPEKKTDYFYIGHIQHVLKSVKEIENLVPYLMMQDTVSISLEKSGNSVDAGWSGLALSYMPEESYFIPLEGDISHTRKLLEPLIPFFENEKIVKTGHDLKADILIFRKYQIPINKPYYDVMLAHYLIDPETRHSLDVLSENYLAYTLLDEYKKASVNPEYQRAALHGEKTEVQLLLKDVFDRMAKKLQVGNLLEEVELPLLSVLASMEFEGIRIDKNVLAQQSEELEKDIQVVQAEIYKDAGEEFNINSPKQLGVILFEKLLLIDKPKKTKSGQYATGEEILTKLANQHVIVSKILDFREFQKLKSTYVDALPALISPLDNRIHTTFSQAVAATGRLSSVNPNLQNIPIRTEKGREIRKAFVPRNKDYLLVSADYSQIELRIMASFSGDKDMIRAFKEGRDIHTTTASKVFKILPDQVDADMRRKAKSVNFGIIYGISAYGLAQNLNIPRSEAADIIEAYFQEFPLVKKYMDRVINEAKDKEYVTTILGRKRYLRDINSRNATMRGFAERNAINAPIQGSAADMIKMAMIKIHDWMQAEKLKSRMVLQVHDELLFDAFKPEIGLLKEKVIYFMKNAITLDVPIEVGIGEGETWLDAH